MIKEDYIIQYDIKQGYNIVIRPLVNNIKIKSGTLLKKEDSGFLSIYRGLENEKLYGISLRSIAKTSNDFIPVLVRGVIIDGFVDDLNEDKLEEIGIYIR